MQLFKQTNIDFIGRQRYFSALSLVLMLAGVASIVAKEASNSESISRVELCSTSNSRAFPRGRNPRGPDLPRPFGLDAPALRGWQRIEDRSRSFRRSAGVRSSRRSIVFTPPDPGKIDFNNTGPETLTARLNDDERLRASLSADEIENAARTLIGIRDRVPHLGLVRNYTVVSIFNHYESTLGHFPLDGFSCTISCLSSGS